jgi:acetylornithine deacetylase
MTPSTQNLTDGAIALLKDLIAIPSFSRQEDKTADCIEAFFRDKDIPCQRLQHNVWALQPFFDPAKPTVLLNSHHDTVKPNPSWTLDPFGPLVKRAAVRPGQQRRRRVPGVPYGYVLPLSTTSRAWPTTW